MGIAGAIAGAAVVGGISTVAAGSSAASATRDAAQQSADVQKYIYDTTRSDYAPSRAIGNSAMSKLAGLYGVQPAATTTSTGQTYTLPGGGTYTVPGTTTTAPASTASSDPYGGFTATPGYQFRLDQGMKAIQRMASARGKLWTPETLNSIGATQQGIASDEFGKYVGGLQSLAGVGQSATGAVAGAGQSYANGASSAYTAAGQANAANALNTGSAINSGVQNLASAYLYNKGYGGLGAGGGMGAATGSFYNPAAGFG